MWNSLVSHDRLFAFDPRPSNRENNTVPAPFNCPDCQVAMSVPHGGDLNRLRCPRCGSNLALEPPPIRRSAVSAALPAVLLPDRTPVPSPAVAARPPPRSNSPPRRLASRRLRKNWIATTGLLVGAILAALTGGSILLAAKSAIHEIEAFVLFLIGAVLIAGWAIVKTLYALRELPDDDDDE